MPQRILVTGATGTVGRQVAAQLLEAGATVRALTRGPTDLPPGVETAHGDLSLPASLRAAIDGVVAVFLVWPFDSTDRLEAALALVAKLARRVVYLSSAAVRDHERQAEQLIERSGLEWTILRPHAFAANTLRWAEQIRAEGVVREPYGQAAMSLVHERDIAAVAAVALIQDGHAGAVYELTGPRSLTQAEQARVIGEVIGHPVRWEDASPQDARRQMLARGWSREAVDGILRAQAAMTAGAAPVTTTVEEVTGAAARTFRSWVAEHAHAFRATMRVARIHAYGGPEVIRYEQTQLPTPGPGEVLIHIAATSFNPSETALRSGMLQAVLPVTLPYTLGWDVAGTVAAVGPGVSRWTPGDRVIGRLDAGGAAAEYVAAPADVLAAAPATISLAAAAAIPIAALTAWQALFEHANVTAGQRVLVNGAGGGVGGFAVQLAKHAGATVIATASARSVAAVRALGADHIVDYTAEPLPGWVDVVINLADISTDAAAELASHLRPGGVAVSIATPLSSGAATHFVTRNDPAQLAQIVALVDAGGLTVDIAESHPLTNLASIHHRSESGQTRGKIILVP
jgi:NADPH:quinone reductase-like Zn-dependent oxidoreductase